MAADHQGDRLQGAVAQPRKRGEQVRNDLLGGRIHINAPVSNALQMISDGNVRARKDGRSWTT